MKRFDVIFIYDKKIWVATCKELRLTLEEGSFDALVVRMKVAIQDIVEKELDYKGNIQLSITMQERIDKIKAAG